MMSSKVTSSFVVNLFFTTAIILLTLSACGQTPVPGCTDPTANNYNSAANVNNGSCTYNTTNYTPLVKVNPITDSLPEGSGLQMAGNYLWSFNDKGYAPAIYSIDTLTKTILQTVYLQGLVNNDWEAMAFDGTHLYIGDFGNNADGARTDLMIYKFPFSAIRNRITIPVDTIVSSLIETIHFTYSDQPQPPQVVPLNTTMFDCEAMVIDSGRIHLFSKNWQTNNCTHYVINGITAGSYTATPVETLATNYLVTDASKAPGRNQIGLFGYQNGGLGSHFIYLLTAYSGGLYFNGNKRRIDLPDATIMGQGEGFTFRNGVYGYISNEKFERSMGPFTLTVNQKLQAFNIGSFIPNVPTAYNFIGNGNWNSTANWKFDSMPSTVITSGSQIIIDPITGGKCLLNIPYTLAPGAKISVAAGKQFDIQGNLTQSN